MLPVRNADQRPSTWQDVSYFLFGFVGKWPAFVAIFLVAFPNVPNVRPFRRLHWSQLIDCLVCAVCPTKTPCGVSSEMTQWLIRDGYFRVRLIGVELDNEMMAARTVITIILHWVWVVVSSPAINLALSTGSIMSWRSVPPTDQCKCRLSLHVERWMMIRKSIMRISRHDHISFVRWRECSRTLTA